MVAIGKFVVRAQIDPIQNSLCTAGLAELRLSVNAHESTHMACVDIAVARFRQHRPCSQERNSLDI
jgi:hypothetical protein